MWLVFERSSKEVFTHLFLKHLSIVILYSTAAAYEALPAGPLTSHERTMDCDYGLCNIQTVAIYKNTLELLIYKEGWSKCDR